MAQNTDTIRPETRYTRADFTALRAWLQKVPPETVSRLYYSADEVDARGWGDARRFLSFLEKMRDDLISRLSDANPAVAELLIDARRTHSWSRKLADYLIEAADHKAAAPQLPDPVSLWLKPIAADKLKEDGIRTIGDLMRVIQMRGRGWYKPIPYLGRGKAAKIVSWLRRHESSLGPLPPTEGKEPVALYPTDIIPGGKLAPFERMRISAELDGSHGANRHPSFPIIDARNDLQAIESYLYRYRGHDHTYRAYQKELERFLLWCIVERGKALSSVLVPDCEAYKDFLANVPDAWLGVRKQRRSTAWRPFACQPSAESQRYAVQVIRAFFEWLCKVRYLSANPWLAVQDPQIEQRQNPLHLEKAFTSALWVKLASPGGVLDQLAAMQSHELAQRFGLRGFEIDHAVQARIFRAAVLVLGETGIRREELAYASRNHLDEYPDVPGIWKLDVLGKRSKWRSVFLSQRAVDALAAHWQDRGDDFSFGMTDLPLISPVFIPPARFPSIKHADRRNGFSPEGVYVLITTWLSRIAEDETADFTEKERDLLRNTGVHALRHTFGTLATACGTPLDVVQRIMGHASLNTTTIYVQSENKRAATEISKWIGAWGLTADKQNQNQ